MSARRHRAAVLAGLLLLVAPATAQAQLTISTSGSFNDAQPAATSNPTYCGGVAPQAACAVAPQAQVRWGVPADPGGRRSGLGYDGVVDAAALSVPFEVGQLTHFNFPIQGGTAAESAQLRLRLDARRDGASLFDEPFDVAFDIAETNNAAPCEFASTTPCADRVGFTNGTPTFAKDVGDPFEFDRYTLAILGFRDTADGPTSDEFISDEGAARTKRLFARLTVEHIIIRRDQVIAFDTAATSTLGEAPRALSASATSGLPVAYAAAGPCTVSGTTLTFTGGVGPCTVTASQAGDERWNPAPDVVRTVAIRWPFDGFYRPIDNEPMVNTTRAGQAVPVKFSLGGDRGLAIFADGSPTSRRLDCTSGAPTDEVEETVTAGGSSLTYGDGTYHYTWKTSAAWAGQCRQLVVTLADGTAHTATFRFR